MPDVNPENLRWARETAALSIEEAARKIGLTGLSAATRLREIERGERVPTRTNLTKMAKAYHRPILALYVSQPPAKGARAHDLRTIRNDTTMAEAQLDAIVRNLRARQSLLRDALEDEDEAIAVSQIGAVSANEGPAAIANAILKATGFDLSQFRAQRTIEEAFAFARASVEKLGIYVLLIGDLGHFTTKLSQYVFRGISLPDPIVPFIVVNDNDSKSAWTFTLLHELAHLFIGESAISGYGSDVETERLCDDVAAQILLPYGDLETVGTHYDLFEAQIAEIGRASRGWKISRKMVAYNLLRNGRISSLLYQQLSDRFDEDRLEFVTSSGTSGSYFVTRTHRLGRSFIYTVDRMIASGALTTRKAAFVLGVKPTSVGRLTEGVR